MLLATSLTFFQEIQQGQELEDEDALEVLRTALDSPEVVWTCCGCFVGEISVGFFEVHEGQYCWLIVVNSG